MKKFLAMVMMLALILSVSTVVAFADAPQSAKFTTTPIYDLNDLADGDFRVSTNQDDKGWLFYPSVNDNVALFKVEDGQLVIYDHYNFYLELRVNLPSANQVSADACADQDMIGFYFENNTTEICGLAFFGENSTSDGNSHQMAYQTTDFYDIECYLVDLDGNVSVAEEYLDDYGHGLAAVPAGFKGYYMVTLETLGCDMCHYGTGFGWHDCPNNGDWVSGDSSLLNVGVAIYSTWADIDETFVIDDYFFAKKGDNFSAGDAPVIPTEPAETPTNEPVQTPTTEVTEPEQTPTTEVTEPEQTPTTEVTEPEQTPATEVTESVQTPTDEATESIQNPTDEATQTPGEQATQGATDDAGIDIGTILIIAGALVVVAAVVVVVIIISKKKAGKAE